MPSDVWKFFTKITNDLGNQVTCNLCGRKYKNCGNTTNLRNHLKSKHLHAFANSSNSRPQEKDKSSRNTNCINDDNNNTNKEASLCLNTHSTSRSRSPSTLLSARQLRQRSEAEIIEDSDEDDDLSVLSELSRDTKVETASTSTGVTSNPRSGTSAQSQMTVHNIFKEQRSFADGGPREAAITQSLLYMICKDNLPLSCTEKDGLKHFLKTTVPLYKIKSRRTMTRLIEDKYETLRTVVGRRIAAISYLSLTTDIATVMNSTRSFIVLTGHFIDEPYATMQSFCFGAKQLQPGHTAAHIVEDIEEMTEKFRIDKSKIISVTTDGAANIVAAVRSMLGSSRFHIPCLAHIINLVVQNAIDSVPEFIEIRDKVKGLVTYFRKSNVAMDDLRAEQKNEGKSEGTFLYPIQDIVTRWNSTFYALERFVAISGYIGKIVISSKHRSAPPMLTRSEVDVIRECIAVLKPFERATKELSGEKYVTASMVIPIINCVRGQLSRTSGITAIAKQLKISLQEKMKNRMTDLEKVELLALATILDPRFKKLHFQSAVNAANAITAISLEVRRELINLDEHISSSSNDDSLTTDSNDLWSIHDTEAAKNTPEFENDGYVVLEDYLTPEEVEELKAAGEEFTTNLPPENERKTFNTIEAPQDRDQHYLDSAHENKYFFEIGALEDDGKLKVDPSLSLNKVGHALHWKHPLFKKISFDNRAKEAAFKLNFQKPAVCQSMYIYKNPGLGSEVVAHQDATFFYTEPERLLGFWIALEDATEENGCLWIAPGSHKNGLHRRYVRNKDPQSAALVVFDKPRPSYADCNFQAVPVRKGTCILLHGTVVHFSDSNRSQTSRQAYTYHLVETKDVHYSEDNWLQPKGPEGFPLLYEN